MGGTDAINLTFNMVRVATHFPVYTATDVLPGYSSFWIQTFLLIGNICICVEISIDIAMAISQSVQTQKVVINTLV